mgnify:CR=1 FL=1
MKDLSQAVLKVVNLRLTAAQLAALELYEQQLLEWNERFNLTAIHEPEKIRTKHFLDSLTCLAAMREGPMERVIDIGSGA